MNQKMTKLTATLLLAFWMSALDAQETREIKRGDFQMEVNIPGVFIADDKDEIKMLPSKYSGDLIITSILAEGVAVKKGDVLMEFDQDSLDDAIEEAQNELTDAHVEYKKADAEYQSAIIDLDAKNVELEKELVLLQRDVDAAMEQQILDLAEKEEAIDAAEYRLIQTRVDFDTLKKLYEERGLRVSTSGDILIEREIRRIENGEKSIDVQKKQLAYFLKFDKSKDQLDAELAVEKKDAEIRKQAIMLAAEVAEKKSGVDKAQRTVDAAQRKVDGLLEDREQLRVTSPRDGILFYGTTGSEVPAGVIISGMPDSRKQLRVGGRVNTHQVLLTVATMEQLSIKMSVVENDIQHLKNDLPISVYPDAYPRQVFQGELTQVDQIATKVSFASQERRFKVMGKCTDETTLLRSGMNCRVAIHPEIIPDTILAPVSAIFEDDGQLVCYVKEGNGFDKRVVDVGLSNADEAQILSGLEPGETVALSMPQ